VLVGLSGRNDEVGGPFGGAHAPRTLGPAFVSRVVEEGSRRACHILEAMSREVHELDKDVQSDLRSVEEWRGGLVLVLKRKQDKQFKLWCASTERRQELGGALACGKELWRGAAATRKPKQLPEQEPRRLAGSLRAGRFRLLLSRNCLLHRFTNHLA
jgi:hypothetical protein